MKHLFLATLIVVLSVNSSHAQIGTILTRLTAQRLLTNTNITTKTGARSITPLNVGYSDDSIMAIMYDLAGLSGAAGDLDAVLTLGNQSDLLIRIDKNGSEGEFYTDHDYNGIKTVHDPSGAGTEYPVTFIGRLSGNNVMYLRDAFGYFGYMGAGALTADRKVLLPDEGDGVGLDATLVLHTTEDPITVTDGTEVGTYDDGVASIDNGVGDISEVHPTFVGVQNTAGTAVNLLKNYANFIEYDYSNSIGSVAHVFKFRFDRTFTGATVADIWVPNSTHDGDTLAVKGDITAMGNFATADLTFTGDRYHNAKRYNTDIDSANIFTIQDTNGNYALNINDTANYNNSLIYVSGRTDKTLRISPNKATSFQSRLYMTNPAAGDNTFQLYGGNNFITGTQASGICNISIQAGGTNPATLLVDSTIRAVAINHLAGSYIIGSVAAGTGAGTSPTITMGSGSTDLNGYINVTTGTTCAADATVATITFGLPYRTAPKTIHLSPANKAARNLTDGQEVFVNQADITTTTFVLKSNTTALVDATAYQWYYTVIQ